MERIGFVGMSLLPLPTSFDFRPREAIMFETKELLSMTQDQLTEEYKVTAQYIDKLATLGYTLSSVFHACETLMVVYSEQKGHEVYLMALDVTCTSSEKRAHSVAERLTTIIAYMQTLISLMQTETPLAEEWASYEVLT